MWIFIIRFLLWVIVAIICRLFQRYNIEIKINEKKFALVLAIAVIVAFVVLVAIID